MHLYNLCTSVLTDDVQCLEKMSDEQPVSFQRKRKTKLKKQTDSRVCIVHDSRNKDTRLVQLSTANKETLRTCYEIRKRSDDSNFKTIIDQFPEHFDDSCHAFHRNCYQRFTRLKRKRHIEVKSEPVEQGNGSCQTPPTKKRRQSGPTATMVLYPTDMCVICDTKRKYLGHTRYDTKLVKCATKCAENSIKEAAARKQNFGVLGRVQDVDLVAREAYYHESCRKELLRCPERHSERSDTHTKKKEAHNEAFTHVCHYIEDSVISKAQVERVQLVRERYLAFMQENSPEHYNPEYPTQKLKKKLTDHFGESIKFWAPNFRSELIYSSNLPLGQAVEMAFVATASESRRVEEAAMIVRHKILEAFNDNGPGLWPPTADSLLSESATVGLDILMTLLRVILSGKRTPGERKERVAGSVAQDICYSVTNGAWKQPKHIGLANAVLHLTGKAELISLLNHFGHCVSHGSSLALENNIFRNILQTRSVLPPTFSRTQNKVLHPAWDNFDLCEETPSGSGTTHSTHGIAIQEQSEDGHACATKQEQLLIEDIGEKLLAATKDLPPCYANQKAEPLLHVTKTSISKPDALCNAAKSDLLWILSRRKFRDEQQIPGWSGFVSLTGHKTEEKNLPQKSVMDYLHPVLHPVTEKSTVQHILEISMAATKEVNQEYTLVTSDLAVAKKAYMLVWQMEKFKKDHSPSWCLPSGLFIHGCSRQAHERFWV